MHEAESGSSDRIYACNFRLLLRVLNHESRRPEGTRELPKVDLVEESTGVESLMFRSHR